jgi:gas vesicle protein
MEDRHNGVMVGALMLLAGGIIGAGAALLFAPQSGKRTRRDLVRYAKKAKQKAQGVVDDFSDHVTDMVETVGDRAEEILEKGTDLAYDAKKDLLKAMEKGQEKLEKQRNRLAKMIG